MERALKEHRVEVRLYDVIYNLTSDIKTIAESMIPTESQEQIIGSGRVIALFKSSRKGIILGCEVLDGFLALGQRFRIITAMGPIYSGTIESLHIGEKNHAKSNTGTKSRHKNKTFQRRKNWRPCRKFPPSAPGNSNMGANGENHSR